MKTIFNKETFSWSLYDFANSAYVVIILSFVFPIFFKEVLVGGKYGDFWWGFAVSVSILVGALLSPFIGALADASSRKKQLFMFCALIAIMGTALFFFLPKGALLIILLLFITTNVFFELAQTIYDSFLIQVSSPKHRGKVSGFAWGFGYIGGVAALLLLRPFFQGGFDHNEIMFRLTFPLTAAFFLLFSLPMFFFLRRAALQKKIVLRQGVRRVLATLKHSRQHSTAFLFLLGAILMNDALVTIFVFLPLFARQTMNLTIVEILTMIIVVQIIAFPAAYFGGRLSDRFGPKNILLGTIFLWAFVILYIATVTTRDAFYVGAIITGLIVGSSQSIIRSWYSHLVPAKQQAEFFGFNGFASKIAATIGPVLFGIVSSVTGNQRLALLTLLPFFIGAFYFFARTPEPECISLSKRSATYHS
jgi:UMF1 family MFS transporter